MHCISRTSTAVPGTEDQKYVIWMNKSACLLRPLTSELETICTYFLAPSRVREANSYRPSQLQHFVSTWWGLFWCQDEVHILAASFPISWAPVTYTSLTLFCRPLFTYCFHCLDSLISHFYHLDSFKSLAAPFSSGIQSPSQGVVPCIFSL